MPIIHLRKVLQTIRKVNYRAKYKGIIIILILNKVLRKVILKVYREATGFWISNFGSGEMGMFAISTKSASQFAL